MTQAHCYELLSLVLVCIEATRSWIGSALQRCFFDRDIDITTDAVILTLQELEYQPHPIGLHIIVPPKFIGSIIFVACQQSLWC